MSDLSQVEVRRATWPRDAQALESLRERVFVDEQGVPKHLEWDGRDADAEHAIAEVGSEALGCGRLLPGGRIGRLAILKNHRGQGHGARLLAALLQFAQERGERRVYLHAQVGTEGFYERAGFRARGEVFEEAGIEHRDMESVLDYRDWTQALGRVPYPSPLDQLVIALARQARRDLAILSQDLDPKLFGAADLLEALRLLIRNDRNARVRVLVGDARDIVRRGHSLVALARRAPTKIAFRSLQDHPDWDGDTLVVRDRTGVLSHSGDGRTPGSYFPQDRPTCERALGRFEDLWTAGSENPEFRSLSI